ncbi:hypothetical protein PYCCODRAFT_629606 [Trametes coccinea BRFM310]|uniref:Uncharacterized protein n=1 Tax=Trametes coccinea (strain BRFM310) TaxID=1353009 RepID=A0A1Y2J3Y6_TRAC3|nr:hypothetical protein PYCCODRAFT_629606 [Trametes coccinea BRFM310]
MDGRSQWTGSQTAPTTAMDGRREFLDVFDREITILYTHESKKTYTERRSGKRETTGADTAARVQAHTRRPSTVERSNGWSVIVGGGMTSPTCGLDYGRVCVRACLGGCVCDVYSIVRGEGMAWHGTVVNVYMNGGLNGRD